MQAPGESPTPRLSELLGIFARAGDLGRGLCEGHVEQVCWIGMRLADALDLPAADRVDVYFTTLLVHGGCTAGMAIRFFVQELTAAASTQASKSAPRWRSA